MVKANTHGLTVDSMKVIGCIIIWMAMEFISGKMVEPILVHTKKIKNMVKVPIHGLMGESMWDRGKMVSSMEKVNMCPDKEFQEMVYGTMVKGRNG